MCIINLQGWDPQINNGCIDLCTMHHPFLKLQKGLDGQCLFAGLVKIFWLDCGIPVVIESYQAPNCLDALHLSFEIFHSINRSEVIKVFLGLVLPWNHYNFDYVRFLIVECQIFMFTAFGESWYFWKNDGSFWNH